MISFGHLNDEPAPENASPLREMFHPGLRRLTLVIALMAGCNYFATQAFQGWTSTYLSADRGLAQASVGAALAWQAGGSLVGGFFWGWFGDRFGRRSSALGYMLGLVMVAIYVLVLRDPSAFIAVGFLVGFGLAASVIWAPWAAELFPDRLRATALSVFNWGRIVSLVAPLATGAIAERWSLSVAMMLAVPALVVVIVLWRSLPETVRPIS